MEGQRNRVEAAAESEAHSQRRPLREPLSSRGRRRRLGWTPAEQRLSGCSASFLCSPPPLSPPARYATLQRCTAPLRPPFALAVFASLRCRRRSLTATWPFVSPSAPLRPLLLSPPVPLPGTPPPSLLLSHSPPLSPLSPCQQRSGSRPRRSSRSPPLNPLHSRPPPPLPLPPPLPRPLRPPLLPPLLCASPTCSTPSRCDSSTSEELPGLCGADGSALSQLLHHSVV